MASNPQRGVAAGKSELLCLAIEASNPSLDALGQCSIALGRVSPAADRQTAWPAQVRVIARESVAAANREHDDLIPAINRLLTSHNIAAYTLDRVAVSVGPGGFTSLRTATSAGAMLAHAASELSGRQVLCIPVPSALVAAAAWWLGLPAGSAHVNAIDGGMPGCIIALAAKAGAAVLTAIPPSASVQDVRAACAQSSVVAAEFALAYFSGVLGAFPSAFPSAFPGAALHETGWLAGERVDMGFFSAASAHNLASARPALTAEALLHAAAWGEPVAPRLLTPVYGREPEAVTLWRARK